MSENQFKEKDIIPDDNRVREILKSKYLVLELIRTFIYESWGETREEWKFYGVKNGWTLKKLLKKRNLFFISIYDGYFKISFVFGEKAVTAVLDSDITSELKKELLEARKYAEGRGLSIQVEDDRYLEDIKELLRIKISY